MIFWTRPWRGVILLFLVVIGMVGCSPSREAMLDEQKESHFLVGKSRVSGLDFKGAVEAFERALEVNPRSASAHFELGLIYYERVNNYPAAIFHFEKFLGFRPQHSHADTVRHMILASKQEIAKTVSLGPVTQGLQRELEKLATENKMLASENQEMRQRLKEWEAYYQAARRQAEAPVAAPVQGAYPQLVGPQTELRSATVATVPTSTATGVSARPAAPTTSRAHVVKAGESPYSIAQKYGVNLDALLAANPGLEPRRMKIGQTLAIPAPR